MARPPTFVCKSCGDYREPGTHCLPCKLKFDRAYRKSPDGKESNRKAAKKYSKTVKGKAARARYYRKQGKVRVIGP